MIRSIGVSLLVALLSSGAAFAQLEPPGIPKPPQVPAHPIPPKPATVTLELSGSVKLRPQGSDRELSSSGRTILFDDESLLTSTLVRFASAAGRESFGTVFPTLVLQRREGNSGPWTDIHTFYGPKPATMIPDFPGIPDLPGKPDPAPEPKPITPVRPELPHQGEGPSVTPPEIPGKPGQKPRPKVGPPFDQPTTTAREVSFASPSFTLVSKTSAIRASARRADGSSIDSRPLQLEVRKAPGILTVIAQGGVCTDTDGTSDTTASVTRDDEGCEDKHLNGVLLKDLTPKASNICNDLCKRSCTNFLEHLAEEITYDEGLADRVDFIDNAGEELCAPRSNPGGLHHRIVVGRWRNTEEEGLCGTDLLFNDLIDDFKNQGGKSLVVIGQSLGGAKLTKMQRDNWRWGNGLTLELLVLWDATSAGEDGTILINRHLSNGVRTVGSRPKKVLSFFQYNDAFAFQNGAPLEDRDDAEQYDYNQCLTHNGIARGKFIHHRTTEVVKAALVAARDRARK